jgi:hypothetical protein
MAEPLIVLCPHCFENIVIYKNEINCAIFRHGVYKKDNNQIDPHLNKIECDNLYNSGLIYGCGKPFKLVNDIPEICDYL